MIDGVTLKQLTTHADERGYFREVLRADDEIFSEGFGQWSHSSMYAGTIKAWHIHQKQVDWWYVPIGVIKAVLVDMRNSDLSIKRGNEVFTVDLDRPFDKVARLRYDKGELQEYLLGDNQPAQVLRIPPGVAHGLRVLQGPAHLFYVTSQVYNPDDEGRIPHDALGYDWFKQDIK